MPNIAVLSTLIFGVAVVMTMVGKGGGNFYVVILAMAGISMHRAAATGQFILLAAALAAMLVFQRNRSISWPLALLIGLSTALAALAGGYCSHLFSGFVLKLIFAAMLAAAGAVMLIRVQPKPPGAVAKTQFTLHMKTRGNDLYIKLWIAIPVTLVTGFGSGMVGVSGGSFLVPLMVLTCGATMHTAVGTASALIAATAAMGLTGHMLQGDFSSGLAIPLAVAAILGGIIGGKLALKARPKKLKLLFAITNWIAALFMIINALHAL